MEPHIEQLPVRLAGYSNVRLESLDTALADADIVLMLVDHMQFKRVDRSKLNEKVVIDTKGVWR